MAKLDLDYNIRLLLLTELPTITTCSILLLFLSLSSGPGRNGGLQSPRGQIGFLSCSWPPQFIANPLPYRLGRVQLPQCQLRSQLWTTDTLVVVAGLTIPLIDVQSSLFYVFVRCRPHNISSLEVHLAGMPHRPPTSASLKIMR